MLCQLSYLSPKYVGRFERPSPGLAAEWGGFEPPATGSKAQRSTVELPLKVREQPLGPGLGKPGQVAPPVSLTTP